MALECQLSARLLLLLASLHALADEGLVPASQHDQKSELSKQVMFLSPHVQARDSFTSPRRDSTACVMLSPPSFAEQVRTVEAGNSLVRTPSPYR